MHLAPAFAAGIFAARGTDRRFGAQAAARRQAARRELEVLEAEQRVLVRRGGVTAASVTREYTERGRHAAPRPAHA